MNISGKRLTNDEYFLSMAKLASARGTCVRRRVGCILVDEGNIVLATGRAGVPRGIEHCIDNPCPGANYPSGEGLDKCIATHAEMNALLQCTNVDKIYTCYTTLAICNICVRLLLNTSCARLVTIEEYPHNEAKQMWLDKGKEWVLADDRTIDIVSAIVRVDTTRIK